MTPNSRANWTRGRAAHAPDEPYLSTFEILSLEVLLLHSRSFGGRWICHYHGRCSSIQIYNVIFISVLILDYSHHVQQRLLIYTWNSSALFLRFSMIISSCSTGLSISEFSAWFYLLPWDVCRHSQFCNTLVFNQKQFIWLATEILQRNGLEQK